MDFDLSDYSYLGEAAAGGAVDVDEASRTSLSPANVRSAMPGLRHQEGKRGLAREGTMTDAGTVKGGSIGCVGWI